MCNMVCGKTPSTSLLLASLAACLLENRVIVNLEDLGMAKCLSILDVVTVEQVNAAADFLSQLVHDAISEMQKLENKERRTMPNYDGTGPNGLGPMTGRIMGRCIDRKDADRPRINSTSIGQAENAACGVGRGGRPYGGGRGNCFGGGYGRHGMGRRFGL